MPAVFWAWQEEIGSEIPGRSRPHQVGEKQMSSAGSPGHAEKLPAAGRPLCGWRSRAALRAGPKARTSGADTWKCAFPLCPAWALPQPRKQAGGRKGVLSHIRRGLLVFKHALELSERACAIFVRFRIPSALSKLTLCRFHPDSPFLHAVPLGGAYARGELFCGIMLRFGLALCSWIPSNDFFLSSSSPAFLPFFLPYPRVGFLIKQEGSGLELLTAAYWTTVYFCMTLF